jgi:hypothetical protein
MRLSSFDKKWACACFTSASVILVSAYLTANDFFDSQNNYQDPFALHLDNSPTRQNVALGFACASAICGIAGCIPCCFSNYFSDDDSDALPLITNESEHTETKKTQVHIYRQ